MRDRSRSRRAVGAAWVIGAATVLAAVTLAACSGSRGDATPTTADRSRRITEAEAIVLAELLRTNDAAGGAAVSAEVPFGTATFALDGQIDWADHVGRLSVRPMVDGTHATPFDIVFDQTVVFEEVPGLAERLAARGAPPASWVARPLDETRSPLDVVIRLIDTAASTTRDNPVLIQSRGVRWLRDDRVDGVGVDVFRDGRTTYWVRTENPILLRLDAELESTSSTGTIRFSDWGTRTIPTPGENDIVALDAVRDVYDELRRAG